MNTDTEYYREEKSCLVCKHFHWFHGLVGCCNTKSGCCATTMMNCMDSCDNGKFEFDEKNYKE